MLADVYEYDQLLTGEKREGQFGVYIDFFGEKLPSIPGEVIPLMLMSSMGYVANQHPMNPDVIMLLRLCFSIIPAITAVLAIPILVYLYPEEAKDDENFLAEVQAGLERHAKGLEARDPITGNAVPVPGNIHASCDPYVIAQKAAGEGGAAVDVGKEEDQRKRGKAAMESLDHFTQWELQQVVDSGDKAKLVVWTAVYSFVSLVGVVVLCIWAANDWSTNIDVEVVLDPACSSNTSNPSPFAALAAGNCTDGFFGATCEQACPGLGSTESETEFTGLSCSGHGSCNATTQKTADLVATCTCDEGYEGVSCDIGEVEEPVAWIPIIVALIALFVVFLIISLLRLKEALRLKSTDQFTVDGTDHTVAVIAARLDQITGTPSELESNIEGGPQAAVADGVDAQVAAPQPQPEPQPEPQPKP